MKSQTARNLEQIIICEMSENDIREVLEIQDKTDLSRWTSLDYKREIQNKDSIKKVLKLNGEVIGFAVVRLLSGSDATANHYTSSEIYNIALSESFQGIGIGQMLFDDILLELRKLNILEIWLEVRESNENAVKFYQRNGFEKNSVRKNYYKNPLENALILRLSLNYENQT